MTVDFEGVLGNYLLDCDLFKGVLCEDLLLGVRVLTEILESGELMPFDYCFLCLGVTFLDTLFLLW